jgi:pimeloyl-ACP methyl ester carboxylesterase
MAIYSYNLGSRLPLIKSPTLLLYGAEDAPLKQAESIRRLISECAIQVVEGTLSFPTWEKPVEFSQPILQFLEAEETVHQYP